jgi:hypothetical protein
VCSARGRASRPKQRVNRQGAWAHQHQSHDASDVAEAEGLDDMFGDSHLWFMVLMPLTGKFDRGPTHWFSFTKQDRSGGDEKFFEPAFFLVSEA